MSPTQFFIEIPYRPTYRPGSGPVMAPVTLYPDDSDTGWVIAGIADFQDISQYVVTPKDNPAHRRPVKKQHILDWVSPKALEDFEYEQYTIRMKAEQERDNIALAKAAAVKERRHGMGLARERSQVDRPFSRYMQLEHFENSDKGNTSGQLSSPEHSPNEGRIGSVKRKRSEGYLEKEPAAKRRDLSGSAKASLISASSNLPPFKFKRQSQVEAVIDETDLDYESEESRVSLKADSKELNTVNDPLLPRYRRNLTPSKGPISSKSHASPHSTSVMFIPASASPLRISPVGNRKVQQSPSHATGTTPTKIWKSSLSKPASSIIQTPELTVDAVVSKRSQVGHRPLSLTSESAATKEIYEVNGKKNALSSKNVGEKEVPGWPLFSDLTFSRNTRKSRKQGQKKDQNAGSSSSESSNMLRWPGNDECPKSSKRHSKCLSCMKMEQKNKDSIMDEEDEDKIKEDRQSE